MAVVRLEEVYLYMTPDSTESVENLEAAAFMDHSGIKFIKLMYNDPEQQQVVLDSVNTWWGDRGEFSMPPITKYPFLVYTEVRDDIPVRSSPVKYLEGLEDIKTFPELYNQYI